MTVDKNFTKEVKTTYGTKWDDLLQSLRDNGVTIQDTHTEMGIITGETETPLTTIANIKGIEHVQYDRPASITTEDITNNNRYFC